MISPSDDTVLTAEVVTGSDVFGARKRRDGPGTGASFPYAVELTGLEAGTSTVRIHYCYRSPIEEGCDQGPREIGPIELAVMVE